MKLKPKHKQNKQHIGDIFSGQSFEEIDSSVQNDQQKRKKNDDFDENDGEMKIG